MELRKFYAASTREALDLVRRELGEDAIILDTKVIKVADESGQASVDRVEVWAQLPALIHAQPKPNLFAEEIAAPAPTDEDPPELDRHLAALYNQLADAHTRIESLNDKLHWLDIGLPVSTSMLSPQMMEAFISSIACSGGISTTEIPRAVALLGPTGAGKTTMIAKLAWLLGVVGGMRVGVISVDTQRIGGVDPLRVYCGHLDIPLAVLYQPEDAPGALSSMADRDIILLDTPGGSQRDSQHLEELREWFNAFDPQEVHLVVSAATSPAVLRDIVHRYSELQPDQLIFSKLDEAVFPIELFAAGAQCGLAISYLGEGQLIADGAIIASQEVISDYLRTK